MKKYLMAAAGLACLAGCGEVPAEAVAREHLKRLLAAELGGGVSVTAIEKTGEGDGAVFGVKVRDFNYSYELLCRMPVPVRGLRRMSLENVLLLDEFFKNRTEPWEKLDFTPVRKVRLDEEANRVLAEAYAQKSSLFMCKPGQKVRQTGGVRLFHKDGRWTPN
jgi:hypothetical protein